MAPLSKTPKKITRNGVGKRKSVSKVVDHFIAEVDSIAGFVDKGRAGLPLASRYNAWFFDYAVIRLYREFELFVLNLLIAAIHQDTTTLQKSAQLALPKTVSLDVCEFLIVGHGFFDLKGRSGAISKLKDFLPDDHYIVKVVSDKKFLESLDLLFSLRNFAAHASKPSKKSVLTALVDRHKRKYKWQGLPKPPAGAPPVPRNIGSSGMWLMSKEDGDTRLTKIIADMRTLAANIQTQAPF